MTLVNCTVISSHVDVVSLQYQCVLKFLSIYACFPVRVTFSQDCAGLSCELLVISSTLARCDERNSRKMEYYSYQLIFVPLHFVIGRLQEVHMAERDMPEHKSHVTIYHLSAF